MTQDLSIKLRYKGEIHRLRVNVDTFTFEELKQLFVSTYPLLLGEERLMIQYKDNEGDVVTVSNDIEFKEACRVFMNLFGDSKTFSFFISGKNKVLERMSPVVKAIEEFAKNVSIAANEMVNKTKQAEWPEKCKQHAAITGQVLQQSAIETGEFLSEQGRKFSETEFVHTVCEFAEEIKSSVQELLDEGLKVAGTTKEEEVEEEETKEEEVATQEASTETVKESTEEQAAQTEVPVPTLLPEPVDEVVSSDANTESPPSSEEEWDIVPPMPEPKIEEEVVVEEPRKWGIEYQIILEMFPEAKYERCDALLTRFNGNVQIVLNALMDL